MYMEHLQLQQIIFIESLLRFSTCMCLFAHPNRDGEIQQL